MDSAYIKALKEKYKTESCQSKGERKLKLNALYKDLALAIIQKAQQKMISKGFVVMMS